MSTRPTFVPPHVRPLTASAMSTTTSFFQSLKPTLVYYFPYLTGSQLLLSLRFRHPVGLLAALGSFATARALKRVDAGSLRQILHILLTGLNTYTLTLSIIQFRALYKQPDWKTFPALDASLTNITRKAKDGSRNITDVDHTPPEYDAPASRIESLILRHISISNTNIQLLQLASPASPTGFLHAEVVSTFLGLVDDVAIRWSEDKETGKTRVEWHFQPRSSGVDAFGSGRKWGRGFEQYLADYV
ncbi:hypothetical protein HK097_000398 [Rhizophlyctis rosea]|uniref:Uncharacterized protein n=1 Tax=Rhizophlyctis rosea TaxID=64517 RepID=A0AAD5WYW0_9FUNG|nr:hypothetical protein HK097_000398 [Rhizophlyctis rosea]